MIVFAKSDRGNLRELNEDAYFYCPSPLGELPNLFVIADGMGGHNAGDVASKLAIDSLVDYCRKEAKGSIKQILLSGVNQASEKVLEYSYQKAAYAGMGTTLIAGVVKRNKLHLVHIGDSRAYIYQDRLKQVTKDHSYVQELIDEGSLTREEAFIHPKRNIITKVIGGDVHEAPDYYEHKYNKGNLLLLCTDGLTGMLRDREIERILEDKGSIENRGLTLVNQALDQGGEDNITLVLVEKE